MSARDLLLVRVADSVASGSMTIPRALAEAYDEGCREGWRDAQRMRAAEIKPKRAPSKAKRGARD
jgi:hypothetical protein